MTVEEIRGSVVGNNEIDRFPIGMSVLAVDDDPTCLKLLDGLLRKCQYQVTTTNQAITALKMLRENRNRFDLVISDVHMPDMDGFKLLELVGLEMDLPVIMLSGNSDQKLVMKGITHGACDYLVKPVRLEELRNVWQHVIRKKVESKSQSKSNNQEKPNHGTDGGQEAGSVDPNGKINRKRKDEDEDDEDNTNEDDDPSTQKKPRVVWSIDLHRKFVAAVNQLGIEKAFPKRILDLMNVEGLTRENVASHLQKYRLYLKRICQQTNMVVAFGGNKDASSYMRMNSLEGLGDFRTISSSARLPKPYSPSGMLGRLNSATGVTLHSLNSPSLIPPTVNKFQPVVLPAPPSHQSPNLFPGISPSFDIKQNTQIPEFNPVNESRIFNGSSSFSSQSPLKINESFNLVSTSSSFLDVPQPNGENFHELPHNNGLKYGFGNNITATASVPLESQSQNQSQRHGQYGKHDYGQYSNNGFNGLAVSAPPAQGGGLGGPMRSNGNGAPRSNMELRMGSSDEYLMEQTKLQGGFVANNGYDSLDDLMNGMMKREQDPTVIMEGEFVYDPYSFGSCI